MLTHAATQMNLVRIMQCERSQIQRATYDMIAICIDCLE